jgi:hypothetical protein
MGLIKHQIVRQISKSTELIGDPFEHLSDACSEITRQDQPGVYFILPTIKIDHNGKAQTIANVEEDHNQGKSTSQKTPDGKMDEPNKRGGKTGKRKKEGNK